METFYMILIACLVSGCVGYFVGSHFMFKSLKEKWEGCIEVDPYDVAAEKQKKHLTLVR